MFLNDCSLRGKPELRVSEAPLRAIPSVVLFCFFAYLFN